MLFHSLRVYLSGQSLLEDSRERYLAWRASGDSLGYGKHRKALTDFVSKVGAEAGADEFRSTLLDLAHFIHAEPERFDGWTIGSDPFYQAVSRGILAPDEALVLLLEIYDLRPATDETPTDTDGRDAFRRKVLGMLYYLPSINQIVLEQGFTAGAEACPSLLANVDALLGDKPTYQFFLATFLCDLMRYKADLPGSRAEFDATAALWETGTISRRLGTDTLYRRDFLLSLHRLAIGEFAEAGDFLKRFRKSSIQSRLDYIDSYLSQAASYEKGTPERRRNLKHSQNAAQTLAAIYRDYTRLEELMRAGETRPLVSE